MSETDVKAVLDAAQEDEIETLLDSDASKWDGLWPVSLTVTTPGPGVATEDELNRAKKEVDAHIRLARETRNDLDQAKLQREG